MKYKVNELSLFARSLLAATGLDAEKSQAVADILVEGDPSLFNQYGVMLVNPMKYPQVKKAEGQAFIDWLISKPGQDAIAAYKIGGQQLFFPNAGK